jgi:hypothetical protein
MSGQRACLWTVLRCRESAFQQFLGVDSEAAAARRVKELCQVGSRADFDRDPAAQQRFDQRIRKPFLQYQQEKETAHAHYHD